jgi:1-acyl-sn-glycerol-3-phosphate acyltransferase
LGITLNSEQEYDKLVSTRIDYTTLLKLNDGKYGACDSFNYDFITNLFWQPLMRPFVKILNKLGWRFKVQGRKNIPKDTNVIIMPNHVSHFDAFLVGAYFRTKKVIGIADEKLFRNKFFAKLAEILNGFPVRKGTKSTKIVDYAMYRVGSGDSMLWFPEGQRNKKPELNKLMPGKLGSGKLAHGVNVPIIPAFISGAEFAMPLGRKLTIGKGPRSIRIDVTFGKPVYLDDLRELPESKETSKAAVDRIIDAIEELRPPGPYMRQITR